MKLLIAGSPTSRLARLSARCPDSDRAHGVTKKKRRHKKGGSNLGRENFVQSAIQGTDMACDHLAGFAPNPIATRTEDFTRSNRPTALVLSGAAILLTGNAPDFDPKPWIADLEQLRAAISDNMPTFTGRYEFSQRSRRGFCYCKRLSAIHGRWYLGEIPLFPTAPW